MSIKKFLFRVAVKMDMFFAASKILRRSTGKSEIVFFPGCSLSGYNPDYIFMTRDYLREKLGNCGILTACCAKPLKLIGDSKTFTHRIESVRRELDIMNAKIVITACQNCYNILRKYDSQRKILSLWPLMQRFGLDEKLHNKFSGLEASIQDSCVSTPEIIKSVREILNFMGVNVREFAKIKCCGGSQSLASCDSRYGRECMRKRAAESPCSVIISYCASCRSSMSIDGKYKSIHLLDLIFGNGESSRVKSNFLNRLITAKNL